MAYADCTEESCETVFYADRGTVQIESIDLMSGGGVTLTLTNVILTEVSVDEETFTSTPVDNARTLCADGQFSGTYLDAMDAPTDGADDGAADGSDGSE